MSIKENLQIIRQRVISAAQSAGRDPSTVKIIGAVKNQPTEKVLEAVEAGLTDLGENKIQEAQVRHKEIKSRYPNVTWHMIGHLQRNKVRQCLDIFDIIHSLDSERLAREIESRAQSTERRREIAVLIEVNTSAEESKYGIPVDSTIDFLQKLSGFRNLKVQGLMTIGLLSDDPEKVRRCFIKLRKLSEKIKNLNLPNIEMKYLSMGMTDDFEIAIREGSNMVRIGRALFGERS
ncbi:MAG: YggS family pyridoxal phosphate-dependent enzyme [Candidatus Margulisbacteria bacterium]|nr:YggS family pyridoxal phosphate-dependent enzyme [Candidatus Margulisiibacteriota bacterium]